MLRDLLKDKLNEEELKLVPTSFDVIGDKNKAVAIIEIPNEIKKHEKEIALALMKLHKNVKSVLLKASPRRGIHRIREFKLIFGNKNTVVVHRESGCAFKLDPRKVYFSPRESAERLRIAEKIEPNEIIMVFFAGVGPFPIVIAKKTKAKKIIGIEINPKAIRYFKENITLNKVKNVIAIKGDVKKSSKRFFGKCDRVLMPLPEKAIDYLEEAVNCLKEKGIIHFYCFSKEDEIEKWREKILAIINKLNKKAEFLEFRKVLPWGPRIYKYRMDFVIR